MICDHAGMEVTIDRATGEETCEKCFELKEAVSAEELPEFKRLQDRITTADRDAAAEGRPNLTEDISALCLELGYKIADLISERDAGYRWLRAWQDWNRQMHHELRIGDWAHVFPDDTKGRRELAERLRAGVVANEAVVRLRQERNQLGLECSQLASLVCAGLSKKDLNHDGLALIERHYREGELEPISDSVLHPYRMTPELAAALSGLMTAEDPDPEHQADYHRDTLPAAYLRLSAAIDRVSTALRDQQPEIG